MKRQGLGAVPVDPLPRRAAVERTGSCGATWSPPAFLDALERARDACRAAGPPPAPSR